MELNKIIRDLRVLTEEFIPSRILHRDSQLSSLQTNLSPLLSSQKARHSFLWGPPGTGKTSLSLFLVEELRKQAPLHFTYLNCWETATRYSILHKLLHSLGVFAQRKGIPTDELLESFRSSSRGKQSLIVLDEVDRLEEDEILYDLLQAGVSLIMISNAESALFQVDSRIRSRLSSTETIQFSHYTIQELVNILADRREWGLIPGTLSNEAIERIALLAEGDARVALGILSLAAQKAEEQDLEKIPLSLIEHSLPHAMNDSRRRTLDSLNPHQRLLLDILRSGELKARPLLEQLQKQTTKQKLPPLVDRTFRKYMDRLVRHGLVQAEGEGRWRSYYLAEHSK